MPTPLRSTYQIKVQLQGAKPPIWRRFLVVDSMSLEDFHDVLQINMGWTNSHLHQFQLGNARFGMKDPDFDLGWDMELKDERDYLIKDLLRAEKDSLIYEYDFGDSWMHKVTLEKILPFDTTHQLPRCVKGKRACPPEDIGGFWGYQEFLSAWTDPEHPEHEEMRDWAGEYFHGPEWFDVDEVNSILEECFS